MSTWSFRFVEKRRSLLTAIDKIGRKIHKCDDTSRQSPPPSLVAMDWALHQTQVRFDIRAEREEYERLFRHQARVLQDRLVRLGGGDRTQEIPIAEWERVFQIEAQARRLLYQARVLGWGKEKRHYYAHKSS